MKKDNNFEDAIYEINQLAANNSDCTDLEQLRKTINEILDTTVIAIVSDERNE